LATPVAAFFCAVKELDGKELGLRNEDLTDQTAEVLDRARAPDVLRTRRPTLRRLDEWLLENALDRTAGETGRPSDLSRRVVGVPEDMDFVAFHGSVHSPHPSGDRHRGGPTSRSECHLR